MQSVPVESVQILTGASEALLVMMWLAAEPGANVVLPLPGFTTFSAFSNETINLWREGESLLAGINVAAHLVLCLGAVWISRAVAFQIWK